MLLQFLVGAPLLFADSVQERNGDLVCSVL